MKSTLNDPAAKEERLEWVEPEIHELEMGETSFGGTPGNDGGFFVDCAGS